MAANDLIGDLDPNLVPDPPPHTPDPTQDRDDDRIVLTQEQFQELLRANAEEAERNRAIMEALLHPPLPQTQDEPAPVSINLDGLPDPAYDREGFLKGIGARLTDTVRQVEQRVQGAAQATVQQAQTFQTKIDEAWDLIRVQHPETAEFPEIVDALARRWADTKRQSGVDPAALLMRDTAGVAREVGDYVSGQLSALRGDTGNNNEPANRTGGIVTTRPRSAPRRAEPEPVSLVDEMKDFQSRARIY